MRNKIARLFVACVVMVCACLGFTACKGEEVEKVVNISVGLSLNSAYTIVDNTITVEYTDTVDFEKDGNGDLKDFRVTAVLEDYSMVVLPLKNGNKGGYTFATTLPDTEVIPVGEYQLIFGHSALNEDEYKTITLKVVSKSVDFSSFAWSNDTFEFDGNEKEISVTNIPKFFSVNYEGNRQTYPNGVLKLGETSEKYADEYIATASFALKSGYDAEGFSYYNNGQPTTEMTTTHAWTIKKGSISVPKVQMKELTYAFDVIKTAGIHGFTPKEQTAQILNTNDYIISENLSINTTLGNSGLANSAIKATDAGDYSAVVGFELTGLHKNFYTLDKPSERVEWKIKKYIINNYGFWVLRKSFEYDGTVPDLEWKKNYEMEYFTEDTKVLNVTESVVSQKDVGNYTASLTLELVDCEASDNPNNVFISKDNFELKESVITESWKIEPKSLEIRVKSKTEDGPTYGEEYSFSKSDLELCANEYNVFVDGDSFDNVGDFEFLYAVSNGTGYAEDEEYTTTRPVNAGMYYVKARLIEESGTKNYVFCCPLTGYFEIKKANLTLSVNDRINNEALTYGETISYSASNVSATGLVSSDTLESLGSLGFVYSTAYNGTYNSIVPQNAGMYYVKLDTLTSVNYRITYNAGKLEIKQANLEFSIRNKTNDDALTYGDTVSYTASDVTVSGLVAGDTLESLGELGFEYRLNNKGDFGSDTPKNAGTYEVGICLPTLTNYRYRCTNGTLEIKKAILTVTVSDMQCTYGTITSCQTNINGFKYGEVLARNPYDTTPNSIIINSDRKLYNPETKAEISMNGDSYIDVGTYQYRPHYSAKNYDFEYVYGNYVIVPKNVEISARLENSLKYGDELLSSNVEFNNRSDIRGGEVEGTLTYTTNYTQGSPAGEYTITASGWTCTTGNYIITYSPSTFTVAKIDLTISASPLTNRGFYGQTLNSQDIVVTTTPEDGFAEGEKLSTFGTIEFEYSSDNGVTFTSNSPKNVGTYKVRVKPFTSEKSKNYNITYESLESYTIEKRDIIITPKAQKMYYGEIVTLDASCLDSINWAYNEDSSILSNLAFEFKTINTDIYSTNRPTEVGEYVYRVAEITTSNYNISYNVGTYTIERRPIKITIGNATAEYGSDFSKLQIPVTYGGMVYYDTDNHQYVDEHEAYEPALEGETPQLYESIIAINSSFAYDDDATLFASIEKFKFGYFLNSDFIKYDLNSNDESIKIFNDMSAGIFFERFRTEQGLENAIDNYIIVANNGILTLTKKTITISNDDIVWQANGKNIDTTTDLGYVCATVDYTGKAINFTLDTSKWGSALSVSCEYQHNAGRLTNPIQGQLTPVTEIKDAGNYIVKAVIALSDTTHYELASSENNTQKLYVKIESNCFSTKNESDELCAVKVVSGEAITYLTYSEFVKKTDFESGQTISFSLVNDKNNTESSAPGENPTPDGSNAIMSFSISTYADNGIFEGYMVMWNGERIYATNDVYTITLGSSDNKLVIKELWNDGAIEPKQVQVFEKSEFVSTNQAD